MGDVAFPLWSVLLLPVVLAALTLATVTVDAVLAGRAARTGRAAQTGRSALTGPLREVARLLVQQRRVTPAADTVLWRLGVVLLPVAACMAALVVPVGFHAVADLDVGLVWFNAMEVLAWAAVWMAGWGANSALSLVGGYRFVAQGLAYELPHMFALITAGLGAESLRVADITAYQRGLWFVVWMPAAFLTFLLSAAAMAFWGPFDAPVGSDLAGGPLVELSGVDRLVFQAGRWALLVVAAAFSVPLFLGGGHGPLLPAWLWTVVKTSAVLGVLLWARRRVPTVRMDRYVEVAWTVLIPLTIVQALVVALVVLNR